MPVDWKRMTLETLTNHARQVAKVPRNWDWDGYAFECLGNGGETSVIRVDGAVAPRKTRGPNKGRRDWKRLDRATKRSAYFMPAEHAEWCERAYGPPPWY